ncbi:hypothetical protein J3459_020092 [Metarhizium acridum]|nr:hypothetical protein J3459_020092 [Metarhizium acridum]
MHLTQVVLGVMALAVPTWTTPPPAAFGYNGTDFLLRGKPFVIIGGQMDPQRIPFDYWRRRIVAAKALGINTIFSSVFWNEMEPERGKWAGKKPANNLTDFVHIAKEEGLYVVLRPGPYVGGARDWGGLPYWLSRIRGLKVRSYNEPFLNATKKYFSRLAKDLGRLQITRGGNLIMVQIENEYGSYGDDMRYREALRNMAASLFDVPLYTTDGRDKLLLQDGQTPRVLSVVSGGPRGFPLRDEAIAGTSSLGPHLDGEAHISKPLQWGPEARHHAGNDDPELIERYLRNLHMALSANNSLNLYMLHGGTNFGLSAGSLYTGNRTIPWASSYHDGSLLDEAGRTTPLYHILRAEILKYLPDASAVPSPPVNLPLMHLDDVKLEPYASILHTVSHTKTRKMPVYMEKLKQGRGLILYEHKVRRAANGTLQAGDRPRDRITVYVNGRRKGVIDSFYEQPAAVTLSLKAGDALQLLVENAGRTSHWRKGSGETNLMDDPFKGINGSVTVGSSLLRGWKIRQIPCKEPPILKKPIGGSVQKGSLPIYYMGKFKLPPLRPEQFYSEMDTYLTIEGGTRGIVWINGFNLGQYWVSGPQQSLYVPGALLRPGSANRITVLELKPWNMTLVARGETMRKWENRPDPDAPQS